MAVERNALQSYLAELLAADVIKDYAPNGLQVAGSESIQSIVSGVSANLEFIEQAIIKGADTVLVHHGFFWKGEEACLLGIKKNRLQSLLSHNINCFAYHLPLDVHRLYGNNVQLAQRLGVVIDRWLKVESSLPLVAVGHLSKAVDAGEFSEKIAGTLNRKPLLISPASQKAIKKVAICTGAAQDYVQLAADAGVDAYITGEISERTPAMAKELGVYFYAAGHHATERYGVQALGDHLAEKFNLTHEYVDIDNPV